MYYKTVRTARQTVGNGCGNIWNVQNKSYRIFIPDVWIYSKDQNISITWFFFRSVLYFIYFLFVILILLILTYLYPLEENSKMGFHEMLCAQINNIIYTYLNYIYTIDNKIYIYRMNVNLNQMWPELLKKGKKGSEVPLQDAEKRECPRCWALKCSLALFW